MRLIINGAEQHLDAATLTEVIAALGYTGDFFAVALNRTVVPRCQHATTQLREGDEVEILSPMQGG